jgi:hypothetical protein
VTRKRPVTDRHTRRRSASTLADVRIADIQTIPMTTAEEHEAIQALAVLIARYWHEHPDDAATA